MSKEYEREGERRHPIQPSYMDEARRYGYVDEPAHKPKEAQPEQPPAREAKYVLHVGGVYAPDGTLFLPASACSHERAQQIIDALNFVSGAESELKPEGSLVKVLKELLAYRCWSNQDDENFKRVEELESRLADLILERNEQQKTIANYSQWLADATKELAQAKEKAAWVDDFAALIDSDFFHAPVPLKYSVDRAKAELRAILQKGKQP